ncbi:MAG: type-F conjugative transfer system protein TraW [Proteobacteria bacterium]|nr:type-F conjugative transfer system protein TraW [Pseudomonadota bacterium]
MVSTVFSVQYPEIRRFAKGSELIKCPIRILQHIFLLFFLGFWILNTAFAKDFGVHGKVASIKEEDPLILIQQKLKRMEERGELKHHDIEIQKKTKESIERPKPVENISKTIKNRVFYYDPTYIVPEDLRDHKGKVFVSKGTKINPLETVSLSQDLLFFDEGDPEQKSWAYEQYLKRSVKLILVNGAPLALSEEWETPIYFDQSGLLMKKLGITHVPALVTQEGLQLRIEEIHLQALTFSSTLSDLSERE